MSKSCNQIGLTVNAAWEDYERLLELRGDTREPRLYYDAGKLGIEGCPLDWDKCVSDFIDELLEDEEDLIDAVMAEENSRDNQRVSWEQVKQELSL